MDKKTEIELYIPSTRNDKDVIDFLPSDNPSAPNPKNVSIFTEAEGFMFNRCLAVVSKC